MTPSRKGTHSNECMAIGFVEIYCPHLVPCADCSHYSGDLTPKRAMLSMAGILYPKAEMMEEAKELALRWKNKWHLDNDYVKRYLAALGLEG